MDCPKCGSKKVRTVSDNGYKCERQECRFGPWSDKQPDRQIEAMIRRQSQGGRRLTDEEKHEILRRTGR